MLMTINTDASYSQKLERGTYAFWAVCDKGRISRHGALKEKLPSALYAEVQAIGIAFYIVFTYYSISDEVTKVIVNTDCKPAIHLLTKNQKTDFEHDDLRNRVLKYMNIKHGVKKEFRHVPAHTDVSNSRRYVNDWCDRKAKYEMRKLYKK